MTDLVVRRLLVDMEQPIARHWCAGDAFRTALFDALSFTFPFGEQFFIDSVRNGFQQLSPAQQERFRAEVQGFIGQEATHRRMHTLYNAHREKLGRVNEWEPRSRQRFKALEGVHVRHWLGITAANEHLTAILSDHLLHHPEVMGDSDERLRTMWLWHCAEESEHKSVAFDIYQALDGDHEWRVKWMRRATLLFVLEVGRQILLNLKHDGTLWKWSTWKSGASYLFGRNGLVRAVRGPWKEYFRRDFHPSQLDASASQRWLAQHADRYVPVGQAAAA